MPVPDFTGAGWPFPAEQALDPATGRIRLAAHSDSTGQAIRLILSTAIGERPMRPEFGCGIHDLVFEPVNATTANRIQQEVRHALEYWEPRIDVDDIALSADRHDPALLYITIGYRIRATNDPRNLVFPFYTIPTHPQDTP